jgi:hypothetical protein
MGSFSGLLDHRLIPSLFALGEEINSSYSLLNNLLPLVLAGLLGVGLLALRKRLAWYPFVGLVLIGLVIWQNVAARYDYGTYKVVLCASWWTYVGIAAGLSAVAARFGNSTWLRNSLVAVLVCGLAFEKIEDRRERAALPPVTVAPLRQLQQIHALVGDAPILLDLDTDFDYLWSIYYLRDQPVSLASRRSYFSMPHIVPFIERAAEPATEDCKYVLVSGSSPAAAEWRNARFSLLRRDQPRIARIENPNGVETVEGQRFIWIGTAPARLHIAVPREGEYELRASQFGAGPSGPATSTRAVRVTDASGPRIVTVDAQTTTAISLHLSAGENDVILQCLDAPRKEPTGPNNDPRELILGLRGFFIIESGKAR